VCQLPACVAQDKGFLRDVGIDAQLSIAPTAWTVRQRVVGKGISPLFRGRCGGRKSKANRLTLISGSGFEEAAIVRARWHDRRAGLGTGGPERRGIKDLAVIALIQRLGWEYANIVRSNPAMGRSSPSWAKGADAAYGRALCHTARIP
jgi:hypothetical protein